MKWASHVVLQRWDSNRWKIQVMHYLLCVEMWFFPDQIHLFGWWLNSIKAMSKVAYLQLSTSPQDLPLKKMHYQNNQSYFLFIIHHKNKCHLSSGTNLPASENWTQQTVCGASKKMYGSSYTVFEDLRISGDLIGT